MGQVSCLPVAAHLILVLGGGRRHNGGYSASNDTEQKQDHGKQEQGAAPHPWGHAVHGQGPCAVCMGGTGHAFARPGASMFLAPACSAYQCISAQTAVSVQQREQKTVTQGLQWSGKGRNL